MFEKETKFLYDFSMNQIKQLGSYITFDELSGTNLHPAIIRYISAEIEYLIYEDRQKLLSRSNFDYSGEEINKYFDLMTKEIKRTKKFPLDYISNIILHAISFSVNYLAQPNWSLVKLIFAKDSVLKSIEVRQILKYVYYYGYIPGLIEKYIQKKNLLNLEKNEIEVLLSKADREIFADPSSKLIDGVLKAIGEFANIGGFNKSKVPTFMFELYLKEKKLDDYWAKLESALGSDVKQFYEISELQKILYSPIALPGKKESYLDKIIGREKFPESHEFEQALTEEQLPEEFELDVQLEDEYIFMEAEADRQVIKQDEEHKEDRDSLISESVNEEQEQENLNPVSDEFDELNIIQDLSDVKESSVLDKFDEIDEIKEETIDLSVDKNEGKNISETMSEIDIQGDLEELFSDKNISNELDIEEDESLKINSAENHIFEEDILSDNNFSSNSFSDNDSSDDVPSDLNNEDLVVRYLDGVDSGIEIGQNSKRREKDISEFFSQREMHKIISLVFNDNMKSLIQTFEALAECRNMTEAERLLNSVFTSNLVSPSSKGAKIIKKNLTKYYNQV